jgi:hypothetical protein
MHWELGQNPPSSVLPTGTVTFLLTDIERSTALWEKYTEQMRATLARHDRLIEDIVGGNGEWL